MPKECRNFNNVGKVSGLLLLLLAFLAVNPILNSPAFAEEEAMEDDVVSSDIADASGADDVATLDAAGESTVGISFSPAIYYANLSPTTSAGQSARIDLSATVNVYQSNGYAVYLKSNSPNLVGVSNSSNVIPSATTAKTYANMDVNTWGYASSVGTAIADSATYKAVGVSGNGDKIAENTSGGLLTDSKTINLSFATKINNAKPADTYSNTMILSVVSNPLEIADSWGITDMQQMTSTICANAKDTSGDGNISTQLRDTRDGKYYWVGKLADEKCWMTQNLDLDLSTAKALTSADTDVTTSWTPGFATATVANASTVNSSSQVETRSWSLGDYRITNPTASSSCGQRKASAADCPSQFTAYTTPTTANGDANAHYILGNHYQWNAATAGTGGTITNTTQAQASSSICPKGWRLPTGETSGEFRTLINAGGIGSDVTKLTSSPYYFTRSGLLHQISLFLYAGDVGYFWSSTPNSGVGSAADLYFSGISSLNSSAIGDRHYGMSVRCIAK